MGLGSYFMRRKELPPTRRLGGAAACRADRHRSTDAPTGLSQGLPGRLPQTLRNGFLPLTLCLLLAACTAKDPASIKPGDDIATARAAYEAAGAEEVRLALVPPQIDPSPNQEEPARHYDYVAYDYDGRLVIIYYLDGKVSGVVHPQE